ncbi:hypothetical protein FE633_06590 [Streptomyces montanus]|uniref:Uncharacterized protein n=1 Tax=Streptomyces montanus TaxID=2580423 RepID=A0A5R9FZU5_9ACTN|nr:hypothetical protein FE633_06590 [Streptomyces montanus]
MEFRFSVDANELPPPSGFDLGHVDVSGSEGQASSRDHTPDQAMMIYLSVTLLLDGLRRFLSGRARTYASSAVDSSFSLDFRREKRGTISTSHQGSPVDRSSAEDVAAAVFDAAEEFARTHLGELPADDAGRTDLEQSLAEFRRFLDQLD